MQATLHQPQPQHDRIAPLPRPPAWSAPRLTRGTLLKGIDRAPNGRRVYGWPDVQRIRFIRCCRDLWLGVQEVRTSLGETEEASPDSDAVRDLPVTHIKRLQAEPEDIGQCLSLSLAPRLGGIQV